MTIDRGILAAVAVAALTGIASLLIWKGGMDARVTQLEKVQRYYHGTHPEP